MHVQYNEPRANHFLIFYIAVTCLLLLIFVLSVPILLTSILLTSINTIVTTINGKVLCMRVSHMNDEKTTIAST